jgi:hypothetical protein
MADEAHEFDRLDVVYFVGQKVVEMAERLVPLLPVSPTLLATYTFVLDGQKFKITLAQARD